MKKNPQNDNQVKEEKIKTNGFFKKIWWSIDKIERYGELSAEGFPRAFSYLLKLILCLAIVVAIATLYQTKNVVDQITNFIQYEVPDFTYSDKEIKFSTEEVINKTSEFGQVIIDATQDNTDEINKELNEIPEDENGILVLKNKIIIKDASTNRKINYTYEDLLEQIGVSEFNKQDLIELLTGSEIISIYCSLFALLILYAFGIYLINTIINVLLISIFGFLSTLITKLKMRYIAILNMAIYSITLSTLLEMVYIVANQIFNIKINYFDVMYILVSCIYMIAAIFILKSDLTKKQEQITKIVEVQKQVAEDLEKQEENEKEDKKQEKEKYKKKDEKESENNGGEEPEGSNA